MTLFPARIVAILCSGLLLISLGFSRATLAADSNPLTAVLPDATTLGSAENCSEQQSHLMASLGLGKMACTISRHISFESIGRAIGIPAFQPNSRNNPLNPSDNVEDFVRYNPAFFVRVNQYYVQEPDRYMYGFLYKHFLTDSTRLFYMTGLDLRENKKIGNLTLTQYKKAIDNHKPIYADAFAQCRRNQALIVKAFGNDFHYKETFTKCGKTSTAALFWYRRQLDGSGDALFALLDSILKTQDTLFYTQLKAVNKPQ